PGDGGCGMCRRTMNLLKRAGVKRIRRVIGFVVVLVPALYFVPIPTIFFIVCGALDVSRHQRISYELIEKYFMGNGIGTWLLSPINLLADLFSYRNILKYKLDDLPAEHRAEIEACVRAFVDNGDLIKAHVADKLPNTKRCMLTFKWYNEIQLTELPIPAFE